MKGLRFVLATILMVTLCACEKTNTEYKYVDRPVEIAVVKEKLVTVKVPDVGAAPSHQQEMELLYNSTLDLQTPYYQKTPIQFKQLQTIEKQYVRDQIKRAKKTIIAILESKGLSIEGSRVAISALPSANAFTNCAPGWGCADLDKLKSLAKQIHEVEGNEDVKNSPTSLFFNKTYRSQIVLYGKDDNTLVFQLEHDVVTQNLNLYFRNDIYDHAGLVQGIFVKSRFRISKVSPASWAYKSSQKLAEILGEELLAYIEDRPIENSPFLALSSVYLQKLHSFEPDNNQSYEFYSNLKDNNLSEAEVEKEVLKKLLKEFTDIKAAF